MIDDVNLGTDKPVGCVRSLIKYEGWYYSSSDSVKFKSFQSFGLVGSCDMSTSRQRLLNENSFEEISEAVA